MKSVFRARISQVSKHFSFPSSHHPLGVVVLKVFNNNARPPMSFSLLTYSVLSRFYFSFFFSRPSLPKSTPSDWTQHMSACQNPAFASVSEVCFSFSSVVLQHHVRFVLNFPLTSSSDWCIVCLIDSKLANRYLATRGCQAQVRFV